MDLENAERYDRQIRLWGHHGQSRCSNSKICLINCNSLGTEILRGLCLAGIGSFTILDSHKLLPEDVGCNFIPQTHSIGKSRAETAKSMLLDLNDEVSGEIYPLETYLPHVSSTTSASNITTTTNNITYLEDEEVSEDDSTDRDTEFWKQFNCVIVSGVMYTGQIQRLSKICSTLNVPMILCKSIGFFGSMRNQLKDHLVVDTHPEWRPKDYDPNKPDTAVIKSTKQIYDEYDKKVCKIKEDEGEDDFITIYICLKALDLFFSTYGRLPGCRNDQVETDINKLKDCVKQMVGKSSTQLKTLDQCLYELCRYGGAELHATSAFLGGCIAQEVIKLVTNQYLPVDDTLIYNAMSASTRTFKLDDLLVSQV